MTRPRVGLLHYTSPPVVGGVEAILYEQAKRLDARGYPVTIITGRGGPLPEPGGVQLTVIPELDSRNDEVTAVRERLLQGERPPAFGALQHRIEEKLQPVFDQLDVVIVHNALGLHFNLALTAALWAIAERGRPRLISWIHDLSWVNPLYRPWMHEGEPWDLLRRSNPRITSLFVSSERMREWGELTGERLDVTHVIPNGIDVAGLLRLGPRARSLVDALGLLQTDVILLAPVRISKRKNLEWAIEATAAVRDAGYRVQLLITGPPGPHNPRSIDYVNELKQLRERLGLQSSVHLLYESAGGEDSYALDATTLSELYTLSDVVVLPSLSEGFGLPLAEAGVFRVPVVATDLPVFREIVPQGATLVPVSSGSQAFSAAVLRAIDSPAVRTRRHILDAFSWERLISERLEPMIAGPGDAVSRTSSSIKSRQR